LFFLYLINKVNAFMYVTQLIIIIARNYYFVRNFVLNGNIL